MLIYRVQRRTDHQNILRRRRRLRKTRGLVLLEKDVEFYICCFLSVAKYFKPKKAEAKNEITMKEVDLCLFYKFVVNYKSYWSNH